MTLDVTTSVGDSGTEVMAPADRSQAGQRLIITDTSCDDAWLAADVADTPTLDK